MIVLAVDTSSGQGSLAVLREGVEQDRQQCLSHVVELPPGQHSTTLHREIIRLLERCHLRLSDVTGYAVTTGPGPFTAVRVGLTAVMGLAEAQGKPVVAVSSLETLACAALQKAGTSLEAHGTKSVPWLLAPLLDARRGQIFGAVYQCDRDGWRLVVEQTVCSLEAFLQRLRECCYPELYFCATEMERFSPQIEKMGWGRSAMIGVPPQLADSLARVALERLQKGQGVSATAADANYVRPSDAEVFWKG
ncbi:MAG: tRNA (adenosine(37)-N6)-threonylcarbamoyltransferase complex dimerization subunit type 1 TsaB [Acidobacteria bacterium]|nr:tRNA (adenosine(37)-N6)-threonylcarbamoyltransferase complex dimerization subunit type 1 TsaB [Acidobacteriota bacterium]